MRVTWNTDGSTVIILTADEKEEAIEAIEFLLEFYRGSFDTSEVQKVLEAMREDVVRKEGRNGKTLH